MEMFYMVMTFQDVVIIKIDNNTSLGTISVGQCEINVTVMVL